MRKTQSKEAVPELCERPLADIGELAGPLTHEVNDLLNNLTLHLAVIQHIASQELTAELQQVRQQITHVAALVSRFQRRRHRQVEPQQVDINQELRHSLLELRGFEDEICGARVSVMAADGSEELPAGTVGIVLDLAAELPPVMGHVPDIRRLFRFLLCNAVRSVAGGGVQIWVRTVQLPQTGQVQAIIEDRGGRIGSEHLLRIFEPGHEQREGMCSLELSACRSIVRRLGGVMEPNLPEEGGLKIVVTLPAVS
jgi:signal transduction histidine kinase